MGKVRGGGDSGCDEEVTWRVVGDESVSLRSFVMSFLFVLFSFSYFSTVEKKRGERSCSGECERVWEMKQYKDVEKIEKREEWIGCVGVMWKNVEDEVTQGCQEDE